MVERSATGPERPEGESADAGAPSALLGLLCLIEQHPEYSQRRLAGALGISLGKAHYLLQALLEKGLVQFRKLTDGAQRSSQVYRVTPAGVRHRLLLTRTSLERKEQEFETLRSEIEVLRDALKSGRRPVLTTDASRPGADSD
jgi:EPS-associated MarR family transcriptional regulator